VYAIGRKLAPMYSGLSPAPSTHDESWPGVLLLRAEGRLFFANAHAFFSRNARRGEPAPKHTVWCLDGSEP